MTTAPFWIFLHHPLHLLALFSITEEHLSKGGCVQTLLGMRWWWRRTGCVHIILCSCVEGIEGRGSGTVHILRYRRAFPRQWLWSDQPTHANVWWGGRGRSAVQPQERTISSAIMECSSTMITQHSSAFILSIELSNLPYWCESKWWKENEITASNKSKWILLCWKYYLGKIHKQMSYMNTLKIQNAWITTFASIHHRQSV